MHEESEIEEQFIVEEQRHRELIGVMNKVLAELQKDVKKDDTVSKSISKLEASISQFASLAKTHEKGEKDPVKVELNQDLVVSSVNAMAKNILTCLYELKDNIAAQNAPKVWEFEVKRNSFSQFIESVKAIQK